MSIVDDRETPEAPDCTCTESSTCHAHESLISLGIPPEQWASLIRAARAHGLRV